MDETQHGLTRVPITMRLYTNIDEQGHTTGELTSGNPTLEKIQESHR